MQFGKIIYWTVENIFYFREFKSGGLHERQAAIFKYSISTVGKTQFASPDLKFSPR
jgi:hypothetical protein